MNGDENMEPKLAAPGAGLPAVELVLARMIFHSQRRFSGRKAASRLFQDEKEKILALVRQCPVGMGGRQVLIGRLRGMEDSSRNWSVFMTVDHLRVVNLACMEAIRSLSRGQVPTRVASTAAVKPSPGANEAAVEAFERGADLFVRTVDSVANLKTPVRYAHPWFGPLDAAGWHFMAGFHMRLHRRQLEAILAGLPSVAPTFAPNRES